MIYIEKITYKRGFSLIELIFVIAVLSLIATFAVPKLLDTRSSAIVTTIKQDIATITTAVQSQYMLNGTIDKISDSVTINKKNWEIEDKKVTYSPNQEDCVTIEVSGDKLSVDIDASSSDICKKIADAGVESIIYDLI